MRWGRYSNATALADYEQASLFSYLMLLSKYINTRVVEILTSNAFSFPSTIRITVRSHARNVKRAQALTKVLLRPGILNYPCETRVAYR